MPSKQVKRKKDNLESVEDKIEIKQPATKRSRIAASAKETKSTKVKKDVNDNVLNEEQNDDNGMCDLFFISF